MLYKITQASPILLYYKEMAMESLGELNKEIFCFDISYISYMFIFYSKNFLKLSNS